MVLGIAAIFGSAIGQHAPKLDALFVKEGDDAVEGQALKGPLKPKTIVCIIISGQRSSHLRTKALESGRHFAPNWFVFSIIRVLA